MRILYVAMKYDYGRRSQGMSFEHYNFYHALLQMGHDILYFDFMTLLQERGKGWMNRRLLEAARREQPDLIFTVLFTDELDQATLRTLTDDIGIPTLNWFCDDHWRFESYSRYWAPCFRWVVTTAHSAIPKYAAMGFRNVIKSQWACNTFLYRPMGTPLAYDVTFVGQPYGDRRAVIERVRKAGFDVRVWGAGWESGRLSQEEMIRIFNQSRINLNLTTAYGAIDEPASSAVPPRRDLMGRLLARIPGLRVQQASGHVPGLSNTSSGLTRNPEQIKGRNFEVPGCGGFLLTGSADHLDDYYEIGKEVACFSGVEEMIALIQYYLDHEDERIAMAKAGYERTLRNHTYEHRFNEIFTRIGLQTCDDTGCVVRSGHTQDVI